MSNTRRHNPDLPIDPNARQSAGFSSPEYERGLLANAVARRCTVLKNAADRELLMFIQYLSLEQGGLSSLAKELIAMFPHYVATTSMQELGTKAGKIYNAEQIRKIRKEIPAPDSTTEFLGGEFPLKGDIYRHRGFLIRESHPDWKLLNADQQENMLEMIAEEDARQAKLPSSYPAEVFLKRCKKAAEESLERDLESLCLDAGWKLDDSGPWYFPNLVGALREYQSHWAQKRRNEIVQTEVVQAMAEALDFCLATGTTCHVEGISGIGKQFTLESLCAVQPGRVRNVQVSPMSDDGSFFRGIGRSIGVSIATSLSVAQIKARIESTLRESGIGLAFHDSQFLFIASTHREIMFKRIYWLVTLVNAGVPVFLCSTPQFLEAVKGAETVSKWNSAQFTKGLDYVALPSVISKQDLTAVAKHLAPYADATSIRIAVAYAFTSGKFIAGIVAIIKRAQFIAQRKGRGDVTNEDFIAAYNIVAPASQALTDVLKKTGEDPKMRRIDPPQYNAPPRRQNLNSETEFPTRESQPVGIE